MNLRFVLEKSEAEMKKSEALIAIKRAGADWILSYAAVDVAGRITL